MGLNKYSNPGVRNGESFKDTEVYWSARRLALEIQDASKKFPEAEEGLLAERIRRSSRSVGENIVIAWALRPDREGFIKCLREADIKQQETRHWIAVAHDCGYIPNELAWTILGRCFNLGKGINAMLREPEIYCPVHQENG